MLTLKMTSPILIPRLTPPATMRKNPTSSQPGCTRNPTNAGAVPFAHSSTGVPRGRGASTACKKRENQTVKELQPPRQRSENLNLVAHVFFSLSTKMLLQGRRLLVFLIALSLQQSCSFSFGESDSNERSKVQILHLPHAGRPSARMC